MRRRVLMVRRTRYRLPLSPALARKFDALDRVVDLRVLATRGSGSAGADPRFRLVADAASFWPALPFRIARELHRFRPDAVLAQSPFETAAALLARRLAGVPAKVVTEVHGDWRTFARLYGSRLRRPVGPVADRLAVAALRRADAARTLSDFTTRIVREAGVEPAATFTTYTDLAAFADAPPAPLPARPSLLFAGVLEPYKNVDGLAAAWRLAAPRVRAATLHLVGDGRRTDAVEGLVRDLPEQTRWTRSLPAEEVARALDDAWALVLPSRSEGTPRIVLEALCRGRAVIGGRVGGIADAVRDGQNGILVDPEAVPEIADATVRLLSDRALAERLGAAARDSAAPWLYTASDYAERVRELVERVA